MIQHLRACLWLLVVTVVLCCIVYPLLLLGVGQAIFPDQASGSMIKRDGEEVGSRLIAQPFTAAGHFQPRPSAVSYNAAASGATNWSANNYLLRDRVARQLGPIVRYSGGAKDRELVGPDIESWFRNDQFAGKPGIVGQWAGLHSTVAQNWLHDWVKADKLNAAFLAAWETANSEIVNKWKSENGADPKPEDLAAGVAAEFFASFSKDHPGAFLGVAEFEADGKTAKKIGPVKQGSDIQSLFFDMWLSDHADVDLEKVPADMVMASGSGLDPHITFKNALWQLDHLPIAAAWAKSSGIGETKARAEIRKLLDQMRFAPLGRLFGEPLVNVLEINLALENHFGAK